MPQLPSTMTVGRPGPKPKPQRAVNISADAESVLAAVRVLRRPDFYQRALVDGDLQDALRKLEVKVRDLLADIDDPAVRS